MGQWGRMGGEQEEGDTANTPQFSLCTVICSVSLIYAPLKDLHSMTQPLRANTVYMYMWSVPSQISTYVVVQYTLNKCFMYRLTAVLPTLVELIPVDDEAGGEVSHTLVMVIAIAFSVFFITDELWEVQKKGERGREMVTEERMYIQ